MLLVQIVFGFLEKIRAWSDRDRSPRTQRLCGMVGWSVLFGPSASKREWGRRWHGQYLTEWLERITIGVRSSVSHVAGYSKAAPACSGWIVQGWWPGG